MVKLGMENLDHVRILIPDLDPDNQIYTDDVISGFLEVAQGNRYRAASLAVGALSVDEAITYKVIKTDDQSINGAAVADALRKRAQDLEYLARREEDREGGFFINYPQPQVVAPELIPVPVNDLPLWGWYNAHS